VIANQYILKMNSKALIKELKYLLFEIKGDCSDFEIESTDFSERYDLLVEIIMSVLSCDWVRSLKFKDWVIPTEHDERIKVILPQNYNGHIKHLAFTGWQLNEKHQLVLNLLIWPIPDIEVLDLSWNRFWNIRHLCQDLRHIKRILYKDNLLDLDQVEGASNAET
jgi:hypothetical protein